jgi:Plexin repeat
VYQIKGSGKDRREGGRLREIQTRRFRPLISKKSSSDAPRLRIAARGRMLLVLALLVLLAAASLSRSSAQGGPACSAFNAQDLAHSSGNCTGCLATSGCGFCLQTSECAPIGTLEVSCRDAVAMSSRECPVTPTELACNDHTDCGSCVAAGTGCSWCASQGACMVASQTFSSGCRGTVFDAPCPAVLTPG